MDPSHLQADTDNDVHSLEGTSTVVESKSGATDASTPQSSGSVSPGPTGPAQPPLLRRLWRKLNIYLLFFALIILVSVATVIVLAMRGNTVNKDAVDSQNLPTSSLQELANTGISIGNSRQILNIQSNSVFTGSALFRSNLEVAGTVKIGGDLALPGITVSGSSRLGEVQANSLAVTGATSIQGVLTARNGVSVTGNSTFSGNISAGQITTGALQLNGDLRLTNHITAGGPIPGLSRGTALGGGGTASVSGSDTAGSIAINTGSSPPAGCFATISFTRAYANTPHILITPVGTGAAGLEYYVNRSTSSFSICTLNSAPGGQTFGFDYMALD